jgi:hypothetical protein
MLDVFIVGVGIGILAVLIWIVLDAWIA